MAKKKAVTPKGTPVSACYLGERRNGRSGLGSAFALDLTKSLDPIDDNVCLWKPRHAVAIGHWYMCVASEGGGYAMSDRPEEDTTKQPVDDSKLLMKWQAAEEADRAIIKREKARARIAGHDHLAEIKSTLKWLTADMSHVERRELLEALLFNSMSTPAAVASKIKAATAKIRPMKNRRRP